jgi:hypothetical protein
MTSQTKKFIELPDLLNLRFQCKHCQSELLISSSHDLAARKERGRLNECPVCLQPWASVNGSSCEMTIAEFLDSLNKLRSTLGTQDGAFPAGFTLTIEIKDERPQP